MRFFKISQNFNSDAINVEIIDDINFNILMRNIGKKGMDWKKVYSKWTDVESGNSVQYKTSLVGFFKNVPVHNVKLYIAIETTNQKYDKVEIKLFLNITRSPSGTGEKHLATWKIEGDDNINRILIPYLYTTFGIKDLTLPIEERKQDVELPSKTRLTRIKGKFKPASVIEIYVEPKRHGIGYTVSLSTINLETSEKKDRIIVSESNDKSKIQEDINSIINRAKSNGYDDSASALYIPEGANESNFDFVLNTWKSELSVSSKNLKNYKLAQDNNYYTVEIAKNTKDPEILTEILKRGNNDNVSHWAVRNENCPPEVLADVLKRGNDDWVSWSAAQNPNCPPEVLTEILKRGKYDNVSQFASENPNCPPQAKIKWMRSTGRIGKEDPTKHIIQYDLNEKEEKPDEDLEKLRKMIGKNTQRYKTAQGYEGYFSGNIPEYALNFIGSSSVDASQIQSMFSKTNDAIKLVNQFDSSLLKNIAFIFNFSKGGAYGVYLPELDRSIKTKILQKQLEQMGYDVKSDEKGLLTAYPNREEKTNEQIQEDIDRVYKRIEDQGGTALGINMYDVIDSSKKDASESGSKDPNIWEWMALLHLGGTIVHEAIHAKGSEQEGPSEEAENRFLQWALPIVNEEYKRSFQSSNKDVEFSPLVIGAGKRHALNKNWYKKAQQLPYFTPSKFVDDPTGSDLSGRFGVGINKDNSGRAYWGMLMQEHQNTPIESKLGKQYMSPLPRDLNQNHDSLEEQLRKYTREDQKLDPKLSTEELLSPGHDLNRGYYTTEELLEEKRPKPMIVPLKKGASNLNKIATLFGWMNNLSISDGSTIPGLSDRVMSWDDAADESFMGYEKDIRSQPRYNPTYDIKGFYYRYIEPRFHPQLFDDMTEDYSGTHPAKRFAEKNIDDDLVRILKICSVVKSKIDNKEISCTRLIISNDIVPLINKIFNEYKITIFKEEDNDVYGVWICSDDISEEDINNAEKYLKSEKKDDKMDELLEKLCRLSKNDNVLSEIKENLNKIFNLLGMEISYDLKKITSGDILIKIDNISRDQLFKLGSLMADRMGIVDVEVDENKNMVGIMYKDFVIVLVKNSGGKNAGSN